MAAKWWNGVGQSLYRHLLELYPEFYYISINFYSIFRIIFIT